MMTLTFMAISSMMLAGCSAALFVSPPMLARLPKRPPSNCLRATLETLLAGRLRPRALDRIDEMDLATGEPNQQRYHIFMAGTEIK